MFLISKTPRSLDFDLNSFNQNYKRRLCPPVTLELQLGCEPLKPHAVWAKARGLQNQWASC